MPTLVDRPSKSSNLLFLTPRPWIPFYRKVFSGCSPQIWGSPLRVIPCWLVRKALSGVISVSLLVIPVLLVVAYFSLLERTVPALIHLRSSPELFASELLQPLPDGLKLFQKGVAMTATTDFFQVACSTLGLLLSTVPALITLRGSYLELVYLKGKAKSDISRVFEGFAMGLLLEKAVLGVLILDLGVSPRLLVSKVRYWSYFLG